MSWFKPTSVLDGVFAAGVLFKGIQAAFEFIGGLLLLFITPAELHRFLVAVTQKELIEDPHDRVANWLLHWTQHFSSGSRAFIIIYLWIHAAIKLVAVIGILRNQLWAYPFSLITLGLLMACQIYYILVHHSVGMVILTIFDAFVVWLIWREYRKVRAEGWK